MTAPSPDIQSGRSADDFARANDLFAIIRALASNESNPATFVGESFRAIAKEFAAPFALIRAHIGPRAIDDYWHSGPTDPGFWRSAVEAAIDNAMSTATPTARLYRARGGTGGIVLISSPMPDESGEVNGAIGLVVPCDDPRRGHELLAQVRAITAMIPPLAASMGRQQARDAQTASAGGNSVQALAVGAGSRSRATLAITITNQLRSRIGCEQVAIAIIRAQRPRLLALSGFADVSERSPGVAVVIAAMCEALDLGRTIAWSPTDHDNDYALHRRWSSEADGAAVATIPLKRGEEITALLALRHAPGHRFTTDDLKKISEMATPYAASLDLVHRATRTIGEHAREAGSATLSQAFRPRGLARTGVAFLASAVLLWFCFGSIHDRTTAKCRINSSTSLHLAAPFDGTLREASAVAGDTVKAGQTLARFDTTSLELERSRLMTSIDKSRIEADVARARNKEADAKLTDARADVERAAIRTIDRKIEAAIIRAPADGVILTGDARKLIGSSIAAGQTLFEFASDGALKIEISIPDRDIDRVHTGATGEFIAVARPDVHLPFTVTRLRPSAELRDGQNVFIAEASIDGSELWMRSGVDGFARIDAGTTTPWRAYLRRAIDWVRLKLWL